MFSWIGVSIFLIDTWFSKGCYGFEPCPSNVRVLHVCIDNELNDVRDVYVSTGHAPLHQAIECTCSITSSGSSENYTLIIQKASELYEDSIKFMFKADNVTVIENTNFGVTRRLNLTGETRLTYSSPDDNIVNVCVYFAAMSEQDRFSMVCSSNLAPVTTKQTTISTISTLHTESNQVIQTSKNDNTVSPEQTTPSSYNDNDGTSPTESTELGTESQTCSNTSKDKMILIVGIAVGAVVALNIGVIIGIIYCMRKRKAPPHEGSQQPTGSSNGYNEGSNDMQLNQAYESLNYVPPNQTPYANLANSQDTMNGNTSPPTCYESI
ncbi:hypothetical protein ACF0H5_007181 [Mactra antiquata]